MRLLSLQRLSAQALEVTWTSRAISDYRIESSEDLEQWSEVAVVNGADAQTSYTDQRELPRTLYYRVVELDPDP